MDGKTCLSIQKFLLSTFKEDLESDNIQEQTFPTITEIYNRSIIPNVDDLYDQLTMISYKTSNNISILLEMPFYQIMKIQETVNKLIKAENNPSENNDTENEYNKKFDSMQSNMKNMLSSNKLSSGRNIPKLKY